MAGINTNMLHGYSVIDQYTGAASIPKYQTSTFDQSDQYTDCCKYNYSRFGNPTISALEDGIRSYENAKHGFAFASGMSAISAVLLLAKQGEHIIFPTEVYGGTYQFATEVLPRYGIATSFIDYRDVSLVEQTITDRTTMLYIETPSNPLLKISDIHALIAIARTHGLLTVADNTFMTALYQQPLAMGCDIVVESMTKFMNGHSDVIGGLVATNDDKVAELLCLFQKSFGGIIGVEDAWLILRGMKTLGLRMEKAIANAVAMAAFLDQHPQVEHVYYPGLASHQGSKVHQHQAANGGAVLSFRLKKEQAIADVVKKLQLPIFAVSLGGVESILSHPATMSHACMTEAERNAQGVTTQLLRLSCGIEDSADLIADFAIALER